MRAIRASTRRLVSPSPPAPLPSLLTLCCPSRPLSALFYPTVVSGATEGLLHVCGSRQEHHALGGTWTGACEG